MSDLCGMCLICTGFVRLVSDVLDLCRIYKMRVGFVPDLDVYRICQICVEFVSALWWMCGRFLSDVVFVLDLSDWCRMC